MCATGSGSTSCSGLAHVSSDFRLRVCYEKTGRLRFLSHLEVVRAVERAIRRAALPLVPL